MKIESQKKYILDTPQALITLNNLLEAYITKYPVQLPLRINNSSSTENIINFLLIQDYLLEYYQSNYISNHINLLYIEEFQELNNKLEFFFKIENSTIVPNLDLIVQNHITDTHKIEHIICTLPLQTKIQILKRVQTQYQYINGSLFIGYLILDLQPAINNDICEFEHNPIQTITLDGIYIDYQNSTKSPQHLTYYLHIISTNKHIQNTELQNSLFYLASRIPHFIDIQSSYWKQFHQVSQISTNQLLLELIKVIPNFLYQTLINTPEGFNEIKHEIKMALSRYIFKQQLVCQDLLFSMLQQTSFSSKNKTKILQLSNQSKVQSYKYRLLHIFLVVSNLQVNQSYKDVIELFLEQQEVSNHGAKRFAKLCEYILQATKLNTSFRNINSDNPTDTIQIIKSQILESALNMINFQTDLSKLSTTQQERFTQILNPLSYFVNSTEPENIKKIIIAHINTFPESIKIYSSTQSQEFNIQVIQNFLKPIHYQDSNIQTETVFDLNEVLHVGHKPTLTCTNYINGSQKEELLALSLLNDRILVQSKHNNTVYARAIIKLIKSKSLDNTYGIILDNYYGEDKYFYHIFELLKLKSKRDNFKLLLPMNINNSQSQYVLKELISTIPFYRHTSDYNLDFSSSFGTSQSDIISNALIEVVT